MSTDLLFINYNPARFFIVRGDARYAKQLVHESKGASETIFISRHQLTLEDARTLKTYLLENTGYIIVSFHFFTRGALDVLLKCVEELVDNTYLVFVTPYPYQIPDTLRSRALLLVQQHEDIYIHDFLSQSYEEKNSFLKQHFSSDSSDAADERKHEALTILDSYEFSLLNQRSHKLRHYYAQVVLDAKKMIFQAQLPPKQVLEYVVTMIEQKV